jgi:outer membrane protein assembly factor BamA
VKRSVPVYEEGALDDDLLNEVSAICFITCNHEDISTPRLTCGRSRTRKELRVIYRLCRAISTGRNRGNHGEQIFPDRRFTYCDAGAGASLLLLHGRYSQALLKSDVRNLEYKYRTNGFLQVKVDGDAKDQHRGRKNEIGVTIHITEGPQTLVGAFDISGNSTNIAEDPFPVLNTSPGQPFSDSLIAEDRDHLLNYYFNNGFPNATLEATAKSAGDNRMDVTFNIHEGERFYVDHVLVSGREFTKPYVIDHELQVRADDDLSQIDLLDTQKKLYDLGIFSQVDTAVQNPEGTETRKNVLVQVQEAKRYIQLRSRI